jgi:endonuclease G, mitochondrial
MSKLRNTIATMMAMFFMLAPVSLASRSVAPKTSLSRTPPAKVTLVLGNPSGATDDPKNKNNFLIEKPQYVLSYNNSKGGPNWVTWHLGLSDIGKIPRLDAFRPDPSLPNGFIQVNPNDYTIPKEGIRAKYDKRHMCPSKDRTDTEANNCATFFMTNMLPQTPDLNEHVWQGLEEDCQTLALRGFELYIIAGGHGSIELVGPSKTIVAPARCWKIVVVLTEGNNDLKRIGKNTRVIAVDMPNEQGIAKKHWQDFIVTVRDIEKATGFDFLSNIPKAIQDAIETKKDSGNLGVPAKAVKPNNKMKRKPCVN